MPARTSTDAAPPERPAPTNVIQALARVMEELPGIGRTERSQQGYNYRGIEAITREASTLLGRYGVIFVPKVLERKTIDLTVNGKPWTEDHATIIYTVYGPGGVEDRIEVGPLIALGRDNSDKGMNKCMTQAFKYALLQTLCIGDSKDDADAHAAAEADHHPAAAPAADWFRENGWKDQAEHDEVWVYAHDTAAALPPTAKPALKAWLKDQTEAPKWSDPWPESFARAVSDRVKALSVPSAPPQDDEKALSAPPAPDPAPEAESPAPDLGPCRWCEKPGTLLAPLTQFPDAGLMHADCHGEWKADPLTQGEAP